MLNEEDTVAPKGFKAIDYAALDVRRIGIGMLGYGFMGKVHSNAYLKIPYSFKAPSAHPDLVALCGRDEAKVADMAARLRYRGYYTDWKQMVKDPAVEIFDNVTPDDRHRAPSIAAAEAGKHVICEKPLAMTVRDAAAMVEAVQKAGVKHMCCFNYRFFPAVRLAKELIEGGVLGKIYHFRGRYLQEPGHNPAAPLEDAWYASGTKSGILLGIGSHIIDMSRFLLGEIVALSGLVRTYNPTRTSHAGVVETVTADEGKPGAGRVRQRRHGHARIVRRGHRAPQSAHLGDQRGEGKPGVGPGRPEPPAHVHRRRASERGAGLHQRVGHRSGSSASDPLPPGRAQCRVGVRPRACAPPLRGVCGQ